MDRRRALSICAALAAAGWLRAADLPLIDKAAPRGELRSPEIRKGAEDVPAKLAPPRDKGRSAPALELRFPSPLAAVEARRLRAESAAGGADPLYQAALGCAEKSASKSGAPVASVACRMVDWAACRYWCCEDALGEESCEQAWCDAKPASPAGDRPYH